MAILITGGTGSLGSVIVKKYLGMYEHDRVIVYSRDEHKQELLYNNLRNEYNIGKLRCLIGDVRDKQRLKMAVAGNGVSTIINCAALKIVPRGEYDPIEFVKTNVNGVQNIIEVAGEENVARVIQVSTDKACAPINLYGATKLCAEKLMLAANNIRGLKGPMYGVVRYGNVAGSKGSVIPAWYKLLEKKQPLPITHVNMTRFWISVDTASSFVINSAKLLKPASLNLFIPVMSAYNILTLVKAMGGTKYPYKVIGIRPGEKIHERIYSEGDVDAVSYKGPHTSDEAKQLSVRSLKTMISRMYFGTRDVWKTA